MKDSKLNKILQHIVCSLKHIFQRETHFDETDLITAKLIDAK